MNNHFSWEKSMISTPVFFVGVVIWRTCGGVSCYWILRGDGVGGKTFPNYSAFFSGVGIR